MTRSEDLAERFDQPVDVGGAGHPAPVGPTRFPAIPANRRGELDLNARPTWPVDRVAAVETAEVAGDPFEVIHHGVTRGQTLAQAGRDAPREGAVRAADQEVMAEPLAMSVPVKRHGGVDVAEENPPEPGRCSGSKSVDLRWRRSGARCDTV